MTSKSQSPFHFLQKLLSKMSVTVVRGPSLEMTASVLPNYSTGGLPAYRLQTSGTSKIFGKDICLFQSAQIQMKSTLKKSRNQTLDMGLGLFTVLNGELRVQVSRPDMDGSIPVGSFTLGTIDKLGRIQLDPQIEARIQTLSGLDQKIRKIDLTFILPEEKISETNLPNEGHSFEL